MQQKEIKMKNLFLLIALLFSVTMFGQEIKTPPRQITDLGIGANSRPNIIIGVNGAANTIDELIGENIFIGGGTFGGQDIRTILENLNAAAGTLQGLDTTVDSLTITGAAGVLRTEIAPIQTINWNGGLLTPNAAGLVTFAETQDLTLSVNSLSITGGSSIDLSPYLDNTDAQTLSFDGTNLSISNGNSVDISTAGTDDQVLTLVTNNLGIENGNTVSLVPYLDNTDEQTLSFDGTNLSITGGNSVDISTAGSDDQTLTLLTNTLSIEDGNSVDLALYLDNTDSQTLSINGSDLTISGGNTITIPAGSDDQQLTLVSNDLTLEDGGTPIDLTPYLDNTDNQTLSLGGNTLSLTNGGSVDLSPYVNTDAQEITENGNERTITGSNDVFSIIPVVRQYEFPLTGTPTTAFTIPAPENFNANAVISVERNGQVQRFNGEAGAEVTIAGNNITFNYDGLSTAYDTHVIIKWHPVQQ
jgi:hypothetical protein